MATNPPDSAAERQPTHVPDRVVTAWGNGFAGGAPQQPLSKTDTDELAAICRELLAARALIRGFAILEAAR